MATAAIDRLGHQAKHLLAAACILGAVALGAAFGRRKPVALGADALAASLAAGLLDPRHPPPTGIATVALVGGLAALAAATAVESRPTGAADEGRRRLLALGALAVAAIALGAGAAHRTLRHVAAAVVRADRPARVEADATLPDIAGLSPAVTSRAAHYTVGIDLEDPAIDAASWTLRLHGAVHHPRAFTLDDLRAMPTVERVMALSCISNPVGGPLAGNARWTGVPLAALLHLAEPMSHARFVEARAADGYHDNLALADARDAAVMVVFGMNGLLLPRAHGFPARLRVPGRYGVKNVKWLTELVLLEADHQGYWAERGWDAVAEVHTSSRIDTPRAGAVVAPTLTVAGVAWAGDRGIGAVDVSADDGGTWVPARLEAPGDPLSWRRWWQVLELAEGAHPLTVRATDGTGRLQESDRRPPHPSGATGWHRVVVQVRRAR
jgi:DMSO/TMAO reductase YedYZ molybdopterin-dependent catalytic subunit